MAQTQITHIERIEIKGLWGKYDIDWTLDPKVNILIGINGSGKTTVLILVESLYYTDVEKLTRVNYQHIKIYDSSGVPKEFSRSNLSGSIDSTINRLNLSPVNISNNHVNLEKIATFETEYQPLEAIQKLSNQYVKTNLDWDLWKLEKDFQGYKSKIFTRYIKTKNEELLAKSNLFENIVNQLFKATNKTIIISEESEIRFQDDAQICNLYQLSSGEKQMLIILLKVLLQDNQPYILLLDEPEISMHLSWQVDLIDNIQKLNENCQVIIATHSPSIIQKGWGSKVFLMKENEEDTRGILHKVNQEVAA